MRVGGIFFAQDKLVKKEMRPVRPSLRASVWLELLGIGAVREGLLRIAAVRKCKPHSEHSQQKFAEIYRSEGGFAEKRHREDPESSQRRFLASRSLTAMIPSKVLLTFVAVRLAHPQHGDSQQRPPSQWQKPASLSPRRTRECARRGSLQSESVPGSHRAHFWVHERPYRAHKWPVCEHGGEGAGLVCAHGARRVHFCSRQRPAVSTLRIPLRLKVTLYGASKQWPAQPPQPSLRPKRQSLPRGLASGSEARCHDGLP